MFTIDLRVILLIIVATGIYAFLLKFLQKNSPQRCSNEGGGGGKGLLNNVKKNRTFLSGWLPLCGSSIYLCVVDICEIRPEGYKHIVYKAIDQMTC